MRRGWGDLEFTTQGDRSVALRCAQVSLAEANMGLRYCLARSLQGQGSPEQLQESEELYWEAYNEAVKVCTPENETSMPASFYIMWGQACSRFADLLKATGRWDLASTVKHE
jgi:hypothetical protein